MNTYKIKLYFQTKLYLQSAVLSVSKASHELWNPLSKRVAVTFQEFGAPSKHKCLQDRANFHRSWARQIVLILILFYQSFTENTIIINIAVVP